MEIGSEKEITSVKIAIKLPGGYGLDILSGVLLVTF